MNVICRLTALLCCFIIWTSAPPASSQTIVDALEIEFFLGVPLDSTRTFSSPTVPEGFIVEDAASGASFVWPTALTFAPDGRIFVAEKRGMVWIIEDGKKLPEPFIDLRSEVMTHHDRGLLGITLHPEYEDNGYVYLLYTVDHEGSGSYPRFDVYSRLTRYSASADDPNVADLSSRTVLVGETFPEGWPACYFSHVIGTVLFASDGTLLAGSGEAASFSQIDSGGLYPECFGEERIDPNEDIGAFRSIYPGSLAGKIIRIDPETGLGLPSNPFFTGDPTDTESKIWVSGLRNPFRFSLGLDGDPDPVLGNPGTLYIADVGHSSWEELNVASGGENFGWPCYEGLGTHSGYQAASPAHSGCDTITDEDHTPPTYYWSHGSPNNSYPPGLSSATIIAGDIYQGSKYPTEIQGTLWYADYVRGWMAYTVPEGPGGLAPEHTVFSLDTGWVVDLRYDPVSENLHYANIHAGKVMRIRFDGEVSTDPSNLDVPIFGIAELYPNPLSGAGTLELAAASAGVHTIELIDLLGRRVSMFEVDSASSGPVRIPLSFAGVPNATYVLRVVDPDGRADSARLTIVR